MQQANIQLSVRSTLTKSLDLSNPKDLLDITIAQAFNNGTRFHDQRELPANTSEDIDLTLLEDALGDSLAFTKIQAVFVRNLSEENELNVGGAAATPFLNDPVVIRRNGIFLLYTGDATGYVVDANSKLLKVENNGASSTKYQIILVGA